MENKYVTTATVGSGGFMMWVSSLDLSSWSYIVGMFVALVGLAGGLYWQHRQDKRNQKIMEATLEALKTKGVVVNEDSDSVD